MNVRLSFRLHELSTADTTLDALIRLFPGITLYKIEHKPPFFRLYLTTKKCRKPHKYRRSR